MKFSKPRRPYINKNHSLARGLVSAIPFFEAGGDYLRDIWGGRTSSAGSNIDQDDWVGTPYGWGVDFDSVNGESFTFANDTRLSITNGLTIYALLRPTSNDLMAYLDYTNPALPNNIEAWSMLQSGATMVFQIYDSTYRAVSQANFFTIDEWQSVWITFANGTVTFFKNGRQTSTGALGASTLPSDTSHTLKIGYYSVGSTGYLNGIIADVRVWNRVLSQREIAEMYVDPWALYRRDNYPKGLPYTRVSTGGTRMAMTGVGF